MSDPRPASRPLPPVAIVIGVLFFFGLLGLMIYGVMKSGAPDRDVLPSALIGKPAPAFDCRCARSPSGRQPELRGAPTAQGGALVRGCRRTIRLTRFAKPSAGA